MEGRTDPNAWDSFGHGWESNKEKFWKIPLMFSLIIFPEYFVRNAYQALLKNLNILKVILEKLHNIELIRSFEKIG